MTLSSPYQVGGSLTADAPSYVVRQADSQLYQALKRGEFCYVLNSRQMGKSSLLVRTQHRLQAEGFQCSTLDMTRIGSENITPDQWYKGTVAELWRGFNLFGKLNLKAWWREEDAISGLQRLSHFIEDVLLVRFPNERIFIFIDEIDSILSLKFPIDDFFALIRFCYNQRALNPAYKRITFAIFGVATPSDLIRDRKRTPFNLGTAIELQGFALTEAQPLVAGLALQQGDAEAVLREILAWTGGQPFLTQKLCQWVVRLGQETKDKLLTIPPGTEAFWVESLVRMRLLRNWESQDEPEHLRTIRDRIKHNKQRLGRVLGLYQQILQGTEPAKKQPKADMESIQPVLADGSREQTELILAGLVVKCQDRLHIKNRIYQAVFNLEWVNQELGSLRPYSQMFDAWTASQQRDRSRLLRGQALQDAKNWAQGKSLSNLDYQFLAQSETRDRKTVQQALEAQRLQAVEARLIQEKRAAKLQQFFLGAVSAAFAIAVSLSIATYIQYQKATRNEIQATATSAEALFASDRKLDALIQSLKAWKKLQKLNHVDTDTKIHLENLLRKTIYQTVEYNHLSGHRTGMASIAVSPDSHILASGSFDGEIKLWRQDGTLLTTLKGHGAPVWGLAFSPDGQALASGSLDNTVKLWKLDGTLLRTFEHRDMVVDVAFSPDGQIIAAANHDRTVKLWQRDGTVLRTLNGHGASVREVAFAPNGDLLASASYDGTVKLWQQDGTLLTTLSGHQDGVEAIAFSPDGEILASASHDQTVKLWQRNGTLLATLNGHQSEVWGVAFSSDGQTLASAGANDTIKLWQRNGNFLRNLGGGSYKVAFCDRGRSILTTAGAIRQWQGTLLKTYEGQNHPVQAATFSPDGNAIASASADKTIKLWNLDGTLKATLRGHRDRVYSVVFSPNGQTIASVSADSTVKLWQPNGTLLQTLQGHSALVTAVTFSADGKTIASASSDNTIKLWQQNGTLQRTLKGHKSTVWDLASSADGTLIASGSIDKTVKLWQWDGTLLKTLKHSAGVTQVAFGPDSEKIAAVTQDGRIHLWQVNGTFLTAQGSQATVVAFSPDASQMAIGQFNGAIDLLRPDGKHLATLTGHEGEVVSLAFSPSGKFIVSADDRKLVLWDLDRVVDLDRVLAYGCSLVDDYLRTNVEIGERDRTLCQPWQNKP